MLNYEPSVMEIVDFDINEQWNDVVCSLPGHQGVASAPDKYSDM